MGSLDWGKVSKDADSMICNVVIDYKVTNHGTNFYLFKSRKDPYTQNVSLES